jgi:hypothetical protein
MAAIIRGQNVIDILPAAHTPAGVALRQRRTLISAKTRISAALW